MDEAAPCWARPGCRQEHQVEVVHVVVEVQQVEVVQLVGDVQQVEVVQLEEVQQQAPAGNRCSRRQSPGARCPQGPCWTLDS